MNSSGIARIALVAALCTLLFSLLVLSGANWVLADPDQRAAGDGILAESSADATVVDTDPVTLESADGRTVVLPDADPGAFESGQSVEFATSVEEPNAATDRIVPGPWERPLMYTISALGALLVLGKLLDTWRVHPLALRIEPRERPLHRGFEERLRDRFSEGRSRTLPRRPTDRTTAADHDSTVSPDSTIDPVTTATTDPNTTPDHDHVTDGGSPTSPATDRDGGGHGG